MKVTGITYRPEDNFFVIDSDSLENVESALYGFVITESGIYTNYVKDELDGTGCYVRITAYDNTISIEQDSNGCFGLYLYRSDGYFALSNSFFELQNVLKKRVKLTLNEDYIYQFLALPVCSLAYEETAITEIKLLDRNTEVLIDKRNGNIKIVRTYENTESIPLEKGLDVLDQWFGKWSRILRGITSRTNRLTVNLSGGIDSRLTFLLALASGCDLNALRIYSYTDKSRKDYIEDYQIASSIASALGFRLNNTDFKFGKRSYLTLDQCVNLSFDTMMSFHKKAYVRSWHLWEPLYQLPGAAGELLRTYWDLTASELIGKKSRRSGILGDALQPVLQSAIENVLSRSVRCVCEKYGISEDSPSVGHHLYRETRCRYHFGKSIVESIAQGVYPLSPLLDKRLHCLRRNFEDSDDLNGLIALIFVRYCPELLQFPFQGGRHIELDTLTKAKSLSEMHHWKKDANRMDASDFHLPVNTNYENANDSWKIADVEDYFKRIIFSEKVKVLVKRYFHVDLLDLYAKRIDRKDYKTWDAMLAVVKLLDNLETNRTNLASNTASLDKYLCGDDDSILPSEDMRMIRHVNLFKDSKVVISGRIRSYRKRTSPNGKVLLTVNFRNEKGTPIRTYDLNWDAQYGEYALLSTLGGIVDFQQSFVTPDNAVSVDVSISRFQSANLVRLHNYTIAVKPKDGSNAASRKKLKWIHLVRNSWGRLVSFVCRHRN
ncbi:MAG: hypothetical protein K5660_02995 [Paludibacteraceae bacterium]|nr:hypothetical protein [Paludibacteraceae bacterium]